MVYLERQEEESRSRKEYALLVLRGVSAFDVFFFVEQFQADLERACIDSNNLYNEARCVYPDTVGKIYKIRISMSRI